MAISDKLALLQATKDDLKAALIEQGQTVSDDEAFSAYPDKVRAIQDGGFGDSLHYANINGVVSEVNSKITFTWPDELKGKLYSIFNVYLTSSNTATYTYYITRIQDGMLLRLVVQALTGLHEASDGISVDATALEVGIKDSSGVFHYDAWTWGSSTGASINGSAPGITVTADEEKMVIALSGGSISGYNGGDYTTALWADKPVLWVYWTE